MFAPIIAPSLRRHSHYQLGHPLQPLLPASGTPHAPHPPPATASWHHAAFHTVTAVVGAGVLGLPHAFSFLGWPAGLLLLTMLCGFSIYTSYLLAALHEAPNGERLNTYREMGEAILGPRKGRLLVGCVQYTLMVGLCITYSVTAGQSLKGMASNECSGKDCQEVSRHFRF